MKAWNVREEWAGRKETVSERPATLHRETAEKGEQYLYYYSRPVRKNLSSKFDVFLPGRSQFDSDHRVDFPTPTSCQSATFVRPFFAFVLCFLRQKIIKNHRCDDSVSIGVIDQLRSANDDPNALLQINR